MSNNKYTVLEIVKQCSYPSHMIDFFVNTILEVITNSPLAKVFKILYKNENLTVIRYNVTTTFKDRSFDIPILIYLSKNMPYEAPEVYLERNSDTGVNPKNPDIDQISNQIITPGLLNWNSRQSLTNILLEVLASFNKNFPIYKIAKGQGQGSQPMQTNQVVQSNIIQPMQNLQNQNYNYYNSNNNMNNNNTFYSNQVPPQFQYQPQTSNFYNNYNNMNMNSNVIDHNSMTDKDMNNKSTYTAFTSNLGNQPPHKNTIYQSIYQANSNQMSGLDKNKSHQTSQVLNNMQFNNQPYTGSNLNGNYINQPYNNNFNNNFSNSQYTNQNQNTQNQYNAYSSNSNICAPVPSSSSMYQISHIDERKSEDEMKRILIEEIKSSIENKVKEEIKRNKQTEEKLNNYRNEFNTQVDKYQKFFTKKEEIVNSLKKLLDDIEREIQNVQMYLAKMQDRILDSTNFENYIQISDTALINLISVEATIEDFLSVIKKAFEKNILNFNETLKTIRTLTRETMKIKFYREKLVSNISQRK